MTVRWTLYDPLLDETYTFQRNPRALNRGTSLVKSRQRAANDDGERILTIQRPVEPIDWGFTGDIRTQEQYNALVAWCKKRRRLILTDHYGDAYWVLLYAFASDEQRPTRKYPIRYRYSIKALLFGVSS